MARVLVVGTDIQGEQALLQRLRVASALPDGQIRRSQDLDDCDLLVIRDTPALRNAALRMRQQRPRLQCWIEDLGASCATAMALRTYLMTVPSAAPCAGCSWQWSP